MTRNEYHGWFNYETWLCNLHFDDAWADDAQEYYNNAEECSYFTKAENAALELADYIQSCVEEWTQEGTPTSPFLQDLLQGALQEVNYHEIAQHYIQEVDHG